MRPPEPPRGGRSKPGEGGKKRAATQLPRLKPAISDGRALEDHAPVGRAATIAGAHTVGWPEHWAGAGEAQSLVAREEERIAPAPPAPAPHRATLLQRLADLVAGRRID
jgi:hypothetical protein